ncbi:gamma-glutamylcyclotransferase [Marinicauda algicola]|uniref:Gamma-glutamylcyclotransferase n=1 Tax=Marinicauda algicola TaxID=2029849 RepID=A0A4S2H3I1_9PROT|nr:gamma-glutamylcyclotransferase family protein [Marinicauda algicola]TGY89911.1 gamma-glutamylcyclotransferase [Marinicauda algicola]
MINGPVSKGDLFVFYGLLKKGAAGAPAHIDLEAAGRYLGPCRFRARLVDLGGYPGAVDGETLCTGELYVLEDVSVARELDAFEDVEAGDPADSLFQRRKIDVLDDEGRPTGQTAWIYWYAKPAAGAPEVANGDWPLEGKR